jgi:hypothetical protein
VTFEQANKERYAKDNSGIFKWVYDGPLETRMLINVDGGKGGQGGRSSESGSVGAGTTGNIQTGNNGNAENGGISGYSKEFNIGNRPFIHMLNGQYGDGGRGTEGKSSPNTNTTTPGNNGYARIYYMT